MGYVIAVAGKGGTGKTTISALIVRLLKNENKNSILAVDADPNSNLAANLGLETKETIGGIIDDIARHPEKIPSGMPKERFIEYQVQAAINESDGFDLLTMGRPEGPGCYCYVNNVLRNVVGKLIKDYAYIVIDNEAGFEHLSRRTTRNTDALVVVSDATAVGLRSAQRIGALIRELEITTKKSLLLVNRNGKNNQLKNFSDLGLDYIGSIPVDTQIEKISLSGNSLLNLKNDAPSIDALRKLGDKIWRNC